MSKNELRKTPTAIGICQTRKNKQLFELV